MRGEHVCVRPSASWPCERNGKSFSFTQKNLLKFKTYGFNCRPKIKFTMSDLEDESDEYLPDENVRSSTRSGRITRTRNTQKSPPRTRPKLRAARIDNDKDESDWIIFYSESKIKDDFSSDYLQGMGSLIQSSLSKIFNSLQLFHTFWLRSTIIMINDARRRIVFAFYRRGQQKFDTLTSTCTTMSDIAST